MIYHGFQRTILYFVALVDILLKLPALYLRPVSVPQDPVSHIVFTDDAAELVLPNAEVRRCLFYAKGIPFPNWNIDRHKFLLTADRKAGAGLIWPRSYLLHSHLVSCATKAAVSPCGHVILHRKSIRDKYPLHKGVPRFQQEGFPVLAVIGELGEDMAFVMMTIDGTKGITINKGSISWGAVTGTDEIDQRIQDAKDAADDAYSEASSVNDNLLKLVQGKYTTPKSTFIDGTTVKSPTIEAGTITGAEIYGSDIYGGAFYDLNGKSKLVLNPSNTYNNYADLVLYGGGDGRTAAFCIYDTFGGVELSGYGVSAMIISKATRRTHAQGTWDFSNATVTGITAVFA